MAWTQRALALLPAIVAAVGSRVEVWMDGGVRSGQDVIKAVALGAKGMLIGRAFLYGLGAMGEAGVTACLDVIRRELDVTMALCGKRDIQHVDRSILVAGTYATAAEVGKFARANSEPQLRSAQRMPGYDPLVAQA